MRIFHFRRILPARLAPISFGTLGVVSAKYDRGAASNRQHPFVEVLCSDITESGEILNLSALVREPLPPAFHRLSKVQKRPLPAARGWRRSTERRHSLVRHRKISIAACERRLGLSDMAARLETSAQKLKRRFEEAFWCDEINMLRSRLMVKSANVAFGRRMRGRF